MGRGTGQQSQATSGVTLRGGAPAGSAPAWAQGLADTRPVPAAAADAAAAAVAVAPAAAASAAGNDAIRSILSGRHARRVEELVEAGPDRSGKKADRKEARGKHTKAIMDAATEAARDQYATDEGTRALLRAYAQAPDYSINNLITAAVQLQKNGVEPGVVFSRTGWKSVGRQIKPGLEEPRGEARGSDWDSRYQVTMFSPTKGFKKVLKDEIDPKTGEPREIYIPGAYTTFTAYHEDATEAIGGGEAPEIPQAPWAHATGSDEDALQLIEDARKIMQYENLMLVHDPALNAGTRNSQGIAIGEQVSARYSKGAGEILIDPKATPADQATGIVQALAEHFARPVEADRLAKHDLTAEELDRASAEAAKYVISSLYGLDSEAQTFPHLRRFSEDSAKTGMLNSQVHHRVGRILDYLDPRRAAKAAVSADAAKQRAADRRAKRQAQKS